MFTVCGFCFGGAAVAWGAASYLGVTALSFIQVLCVYGYSLSAFIPAAVSSTATLFLVILVFCPALSRIRAFPHSRLQLLCVIPITAVQWTVVLAATLISGLFVIKAVWPAVRDGLPASQGRVLLLALLGAHIFFGLVLKLYFFSFSAASP